MKPNFLVKTRRQAIARARRKFGLKDFSGALGEWDELLKRNADDPLAWLGRFDCLMKLDRKEEMLAIGDRVCELFPESEAAHNNYACLLLERREFDKACRYFDTALALAPARTMYYYNAGLAYRGAGKLNQAAVCFEQVLIKEPQHERALEFLSQIYLQFGMADKTIALSMRLRMLRPGYTLPLQRRLYCMVNDSAISEDELNLELSLLRSALVAPDKSAGTRSRGMLRIAWIVCPYSIGFLRYVLPVLKRVRDESAITLVGICNQPLLDLDGLDSCFDEFHRTDSASTAAMAELFNDHSVDVLVDTSAQVPNNLLQHFAGRLAPLQISWPFYHSQLEMVLMDQALVDASLMPSATSSGKAAGIERTVTLADRLVGVDGSQFFYDPATLPTCDDAGSPSRLRGYVTFGVIADPIRINRASVNAWAQILRQVPDSRLAFHHPNFPALIAENHLVELCGEAGLTSDRIEFEPASSDFERRHEKFSRFDILLSPFPVTDDMGLVDALLSGCPVVTLVRGVRGATRAKSILVAAGQPQFIAYDLDEYVAKAIALASHPEELDAQRIPLSNDVRGSAICNADQLGKDWFAKVRQIWARRQ